MIDYVLEPPVVLKLHTSSKQSLHLDSMHTSMEKPAIPDSPQMQIQGKNMLQ